MRKILWGVLALVVVAALVLWFARRPIGEMLVERTIEANVGGDPAAKLGDGLHVFMCGTGSPLPDADRAGPCIGVVAGKDAFVFDAGSGSVRKLMRMGFPADRMKAAFLTHLHSDHIDGLGELLLQAWIAGGRNAPLPVYGPQGTEQVVAGFSQAYAIDEGFRIAHHGPQVARSSGFGGAAQILPVPLASATAWEGDGVRITVIKVNHAPVAPAFGYRIDYKGRSISISGDTTYTQEFTGASKGVDVMFHEALNPQFVGEMGAAMERRGRKDAAKIMHDIPGYHASPEDAARSAQGAGAKVLVLYHLVPGPPLRYLNAAFLGDAPDKFDGPIKVGRDGMLVSLPANGEEIKFEQVL